MKVGTPNFNGECLKEAREACELTLTALARLAEVPKSSLSQYENGVHSPQLDVLERIAGVLKMPVRFFLQPNRSRELNTVFFRSNSYATKAQRTMAIARHKWLRDIVGYLRRFVVFPAVNVPECSEDWQRLRSVEIEVVARDCRRHWGLGDGPISDVVLLFENNGIVVARGDLGADGLDGYSEWSSEDDTPYMFLGADKACAARSRFDAAHELGHIVCHRQVAPATLNSSPDFKRIEEQANQFAGAFLLPAETFTRDFNVPSVETFRYLKPKWRVSIALMIMRCSQLGILTDEGAKRLWIDYNRRGWRKREPLDDSLLCEQPKFLCRSFDAILGSQLQTREDILANIPLPPAEIEKLSNLPEGYLRMTNETMQLGLPVEHNGRDGARRTARIFPLEPFKNTP